MARDHPHNRRPAEKSGMHLFDFNETLSGKRALEYQMEKLYKNRAPSVDLLLNNPRAARQREDGELIRNVPKKMHAGGESLTKGGGGMEANNKQRGPSVVARLMGLDSLPSEPKASPGEPPKHPRKKPVDHPVTKPVTSKPEKQLENPRFDRVSDDRRRVKELPELHELEEMKRQLSMKQMLVRDKLNEAKRLLTGEKLSDKKWINNSNNNNTSNKLKSSKEFMEAIDFFQSNRDAFLRYVDDQDSILGKHIQSSSSSTSKLSKNHHHHQQLHHQEPRQVPENLRNPIVRKVIEGRREDALRNQVRAPECSDDGFRNPVVDNPVATRIVVLKPSPNRAISSPSFSPGSFDHLKPQAPVPPPGRRLESSNDETSSNPREIAKEIAREVRESVVRDLARNAAAELGSERRLNVPLESFDGPKMMMNREAPGKKMNSGLKTKENLRFEEPGARKLTSSPTQTSSRKPGFRSRQSPVVSKGIVVLIPDQNAGNRSGRAPEKRIKDRNRRGSQETFVDQSLRKNSEKKLETEVMNRSGVEEPEKIDDSRSVSGGDQLGGSFILKPSSVEPESQNEEASCEKETIESEFTADVCSESFRSPVENPSSDFISSCESFPSEPSTVSINQELESELRVLQPEPEAVQEAEVLQEEETKETRMSSGAEAPDVDGTSVSSDTSGQPSPISVLDSSFEDSPPRVDFDTISSELEELRMQLRLLKWDGHEEIPAEESTQSLDELIVDKVVVEETQKMIIEDEPVVDVDRELWVEFDELELDSIALILPEGRKQEHLYVKYILLAAKMISNESSSFLVECYSSRQALDPVLFEKIEGYYRARLNHLDDDQSKSCSRSKRRNLFDAVNEILTLKFSSIRAWDHPPVSCGGFLLGEVWSRLSEFFEFPQGEDLQQTVENLIEKYLTRGEKWMDLRAHVEAVGAEVERLILCELIEESVSCLGL